MRSSGGLIFNNSSSALWFVHQAFDRHLPAVGFKPGRRRCHAFLVRRKFIKIIVVRDVLQRCRRIFSVKAVDVVGGGSNQPLDPGGFDGASSHRIEPAINQSGCHRAGRQDARLNEAAAVEINRRWGDLTAGNFV